jgi:hypothetical protein
MASQLARPGSMLLSGWMALRPGPAASPTHARGPGSPPHQLGSLATARPTTAARHHIGHEVECEQHVSGCCTRLGLLLTLIPHPSLSHSRPSATAGGTVARRRSGLPDCGDCLPGPACVACGLPLRSPRRHHGRHVGFPTSLVLYRSCELRRRIVNVPDLKAYSSVAAKLLRRVTSYASSEALL